MNSLNKKCLTLLTIGLLFCAGAAAQTRNNNAPNNATGAIKKNPKMAATKPAPKSIPVNSTTKPVPKKTVVAPAKPAPTPTVALANKDYDYDYRNAIGVRIGQTAGITIKHFTDHNHAIEGIIGISPNAVGLTGLYEKYVQVGDIEGLNWYFGGGAHISVGTGRLYTVYREGRYFSYRSRYPGVGLGIDGILGAEYKIPSIPFALSFDIKPFLEVNSSGVLFTAFDPGLGLKFTF